MTIALTEALQQALDKQPNEPLCVIDPRNQRTYVLVRADVYQKLKGLSYDDAEFPIQEAYPLMDAVAAKQGWDDADMDSYDELPTRNQP